MNDYLRETTDKKSIYMSLGLKGVSIYMSLGLKGVSINTG
jgi:hypothetical protein